MRMIDFFPENVYFGVNILLGVDAHFNPTSHNVLNELIHAFFHFLVIFRFLDVFLDFLEELLL